MSVSVSLGRQFPFRTPGGLFLSLSVGKTSISAPKSLTGSPICEPPVPTGYSTVEQSAHAGFRFFRLPIPVLNPQLAVFEPKCWKSVHFRSKLPNRESYLRAVSPFETCCFLLKFICIHFLNHVLGLVHVPPIDLEAIMYTRRWLNYFLLI